MYTHTKTFIKQNKLCLKDLGAFAGALTASYLEAVRTIKKGGLQSILDSGANAYLQSVRQAEEIREEFAYRQSVRQAAEIREELAGRRMYECPQCKAPRNGDTFSEEPASLKESLELSVKLIDWELELPIVVYYLRKALDVATEGINTERG